MTDRIAPNQIATARTMLLNALAKTWTHQASDWDLLQSAVSTFARAAWAVGAASEEIVHAVRWIVGKSFASEGIPWRLSVVSERVARFAGAACRELRADPAAAREPRKSDVLPELLYPLTTPAAVHEPPGVEHSTSRLGASNTGVPACRATVYWPNGDRGTTAERAGGNEATPGANGQTILLVDDDRQVLAVQKRILTDAGYTVLDAEGGAHALTLCAQHLDTIGLLVTDVMMPGMGGRALMARLASLRRGLKTLKVLYISGCVDDPFARLRAANPSGAFLSKPFSPDTLVRKVQELLTVGLAPAPSERAAAA